MPNNSFLSYHSSINYFSLQAAPYISMAMALFCITSIPSLRDFHENVIKAGYLRRLHLWPFTIICETDYKNVVPLKIISSIRFSPLTFGETPFSLPAVLYISSESYDSSGRKYRFYIFLSIHCCSRYYHFIKGNTTPSHFHFVCVFASWVRTNFYSPVFHKQLMFSSRQLFTLYKTHLVWFQTLYKAPRL